jgi:CTP synthase
VIKALEHSAMRCDRKLNIVWIDSDHLEDDVEKKESPKYYSAWSRLTAASGSE